MTNKSSDNLVWIDCEFTTQDLENAYIFQIAMIVTDSNLEPKSFHGHYGLKFDLWLSEDEAKTASDFVIKNQQGMTTKCRARGKMVEKAKKGASHASSNVTRKAQKSVYASSRKNV